MNKDDERNFRKAISFIEELGWILKSQPNLRLDDFAKTLKQLEKERNLFAHSQSVNQLGVNHASPNPNIHFLIGVLPRLFQDQRLFPTNTHIAQFAEEILGIEVSRHEKRSKYELIGLIICETDHLSDKNLDRLVFALSKIQGDETRINKIRVASREKGFSWNRAIRELAELHEE